MRWRRLLAIFGRSLHFGVPNSTQHYDKETNLVYFRHRYYDPELREWLTPDPLKQTEDLYGYCFGEPDKYIDLDGRWAVPLVRVVWGAGVAITSPAWAPYATAIAVGAGVGYLAGEAYKAYRDSHVDLEEKEKTKEEKKNPPYNGKDLGLDPTKCPGKGFEWRGKGSPKSGKGSWYNKETKESLHPDLDHPGEMKPHWDYEQRANEKKARLFTDGTWGWKDE